MQLDARPANVAAAMAVAMELGVSEADIVSPSPFFCPARRIASRWPRLQAARSSWTTPTTPTPPARRVALAALSKLSKDGRRVVVTPGMVELGRRQRPENARFAEEAARTATDLIVVGRTNRRSLLLGAGRARTGVGPSEQVARTFTFATRDGAVSWVRENLGAGDVVLYENDLPDHYP